MPVRRGVPWGLVALMLGYLLIAPGYFLGPLAALLLISRLASLREWIWLIGSGLGIAYLLRAPGGLAIHLPQAGLALVAGGFAAATLWKPPVPFFRRAVIAVAAAAIAIAIWFVALHLTWADLMRSEATAWRAQLQASSQLLSSSLNADDVSRFITTWVPLYPALQALAALAGLALAWAWYHRIASWPRGAPLGSIRSFRFSDHAVWLLIAALGLMVAPASGTLDALGRNLLLVLAALYALRGLGVFLTSAARVSRAVVGVIAVISLALFPFAAGGLALLGVADTWLDFRRHLAPPIGGVKQ